MKLNSPIPPDTLDHHQLSGMPGFRVPVSTIPTRVIQGSANSLARSHADYHPSIQKYSNLYHSMRNGNFLGLHLAPTSKISTLLLSHSFNVRQTFIEPLPGTAISRDTEVKRSDAWLNHCHACDWYGQPFSLLSSGEVSLWNHMGLALIHPFTLPVKRICF